MKSPKIISAGFLIRSKGYYLLGHPTNHKNWSILKGCVDEGETILQAACRELKEESSIDLNDVDLLMSCHIIPIGTYDIPSKKKMVYVFLLDDVKGLLVDYQLGTDIKCTSYFDYKGKQILEMDAFSWFSREDLEETVLQSQKPLIKLMEQKGL